MDRTRRTLLKGIGGALTLPLLESTALAGQAAPTRFLVVGNPFGMHPDFFFPREFGKDVTLPQTLQSLEWVKERMTILAHADHNMVSGHGKEIALYADSMVPFERDG